jgi:hypothetical protein
MTNLHAMTTHFISPDEGGPFRVADAVATGMTRGKLQGSRYRSLARGVVIPREQLLDFRARCAGMRLILPDRAIFSHHTAAQLYGVPAPRDSLLHISLISEIEPRIQGVSAHRVLELPQPRWIHGLPVTSPGRTFVDLASKLDLYALVEAGDALARLAGSKDELELAISQGRGRRGIRLAREAFKLIDPRADSAPESRMRVLLTLAGFPPDLVNEEIHDERGCYLFKPDNGYWVKLGLEYEGSHHRVDERQWDRDIDRDARYQSENWHLIKVTKSLLYERPQELVARVAAVLHQRGWHPPR